MKAENVTWKDYLQGYYFEEKYKEVFGKSEKLRQKYEGWLNLNQGDLRYKNVPKVIIKEKNDEIIAKKFNANYSFRFLCTTTGRQSRKIKTNELQFYGISQNDIKKGGDYPDKYKIEDKSEKFIDYYYELRKNIYKDITDFFATSTQDKYHEYLNSDEWQQKRKDALEYYGHQCRITESKENLQIHHVHYDSVGDEKMTDLMVLTASKHYEYHANINNDSNEVVRMINEYKYMLKQ